jgi:hypothetical protein
MKNFIKNENNGCGFYKIFKKILYSFDTIFFILERDENKDEKIDQLIVDLKSKIKELIKCAFSVFKFNKAPLENVVAEESNKILELKIDQFQKSIDNLIALMEVNITNQCIMICMFCEVFYPLRFFWHFFDFIKRFITDKNFKITDLQPIIINYILSRDSYGLLKEKYLQNTKKGPLTNWIF